MIEIEMVLNEMILDEMVLEKIKSVAKIEKSIDLMGHIFGKERCHCGTTAIEFFSLPQKERTKCEAFVQDRCIHCGIHISDGAIAETCIGNSGKLYLSMGWITAMLRKRTRPEIIIQKHDFKGCCHKDLRCVKCGIYLFPFLERSNHLRLDCSVD